MKQLHWTKLADVKIKGTMWEKEVGDEMVQLKVTACTRVHAWITAPPVASAPTADELHSNVSNALPHQPPTN